MGLVIGVGPVGWVRLSGWVYADLVVVLSGADGVLCGFIGFNLKY